MNEPIQCTLEDMQAGAEMALAMDRARGAPIPNFEPIEQLYMIGFASGADWALKKLKGEL